MTPDFLSSKGAQDRRAGHSQQVGPDCQADLPRLALSSNGTPACSRVGATKTQRLTSPASRFQTGAPNAKMSFPILIVILLVIVSAPSPSLAAAAQPLPPSVSSAVAQTMDTLDDKHKLAIGDRLSFRILEDLEDPAEPPDPKQLIVADSGELEVPYLGRFPAENKTCKQLARELKVALEKDYYHQATVLIAVDLMARTRGKVYLVGPVRVPGPQDIPSDEVLTLSKAIMRAGGFNDYANKKNVKVTRKGSGSGETDKKTFVVDVGEILEKGRVERDLVLEPGDLILVPESLIRF